MDDDKVTDNQTLQIETSDISHQKIVAYERVIAAAEEQLKSESQKILQLEDRLKSLQQTNACLERKLDAEIEARISAQENLRLYADRFADLEKQLAQLAAAKAHAEKLICDCCGKDNTHHIELVRIDSGHLFCRDCLTALRR